MELKVRLGDRTEPVWVEPLEGGRYRVRVGDRTLEVDAREVGHFDSLLIDGRQFELAVSQVSKSLGASRLVVDDGRSAHTIEVLEPLAYLAEEVGAGGSGAGVAVVRAYMPGRVVQVLVEEGAAVAAGQGVLVLEAMKMENEIQAETAGVVAQVFVAPGQAVEGGDPLFEIAPE